MIGRSRTGWIPMLGRTEDLLHTFPARPLRADERALLAEWLAAASDVSSAFVSERRTDDPAIQRRIAISVEGSGAFTHFIHTPVNNDVWIVLNVQYRPEVHQFDTLLEALNFVRPVLLWAPAWPAEQRADHLQHHQESRAGVEAETERRHFDWSQPGLHPTG
jgi:hypothetical protein